MLIFLIINFSYLMASTPICGPETHNQQAFDILHYDVVLDLTLAPTPVTKGIATISLRWLKDRTNEDFYFMLRSLIIDSIFYNGKSSLANINGNTSDSIYYYSVTPLGAKLDTDIVKIYYSGTMTSEPGTQAWGGVLSYPTQQILFSNGVGFHNNYVSATQHWMPCFDHPSDKATFSGHFKVKKNMICASVGMLKIDSSSSDYNIYNWEEKFPCASYLMTFGVAPFKELRFDTDSLPVVVYTYKDTTQTRHTFKLITKAISMLERYFGKYPFDKVGYYTAPVGSMEHQTMITLSDALISPTDTINKNAYHELSHMWFGDMLTCADFTHAWLNESFATFTESLWRGELNGFNDYLNSQKEKLSRYLNYLVPQDGVIPLYHFPREKTSNYPETIYQKGALVLGMLRYIVGDSLYFLSMKKYLEKFKYGNVTSEELKSVLEQYCKTDLTSFFNQWIYGAGFPILTIEAHKMPNANGKVDCAIYINQTQPANYGIYTELPLEFTFTDSASNKFNRVYYPKSANDVAQFKDLDNFVSCQVNSGPSVRSLIKITSIKTEIFSFDQTLNTEIYPNPATDEIFVDYQTNNNQKNEIKIFNQLGECVYKLLTDDNFLKVDVSRLSDGIYFLNHSTGTNNARVRFLIAR
ncbi:MAG: M1 family aminopeptidase [Candidatus Kapabacteria bacterium]|nr:M1 family aminopeptidase [Candidatus Kapabacteria bacterium]